MMELTKDMITVGRIDKAFLAGRLEGELRTSIYISRTRVLIPTDLVLDVLAG
jgi:hypothetical protein